ncbi:AzlC family ABC transporter permease [Peribacillus deserti]|uniref:Branched-chain amino acid ABC transporter permease n=1 Tax=Peribacillus deserti TaxID=673318 RepID=A0A2N5M016_9BACI|nr:AzlC family ABC transporter permease [Peribacillus deserti]PLT27717.1 branched-chain amino acid ABC transporter permease [Peribacillus deserti]
MADLVFDRGTSSFRRGLQEGTSIAIGYFPIAITFGLIAKSTGLTLTETVLMSLIVFAGASQYMALNLLTLGTGIYEIILTTFIVNIRHFLMSASLNEIAEDDHLLKKAGYAFGITDETFSVASMNNKEVTTGYMYGVNGISYASWVVSSGLGFIFGAALPQVLQESMSIALYAMFIGLLVPSLKGNAKVVMLSLTAACLNSAFTLSHVLSTGWSIVASTLLAAISIEAASVLKKRGGAQGE